MTRPDLDCLRAPASVVIVGCFGRMGGMLFREAGSRGFGVRGIDKPLTELEPLTKARMVIVCVPAAVLERTLHTICPHMAHDAILSDITSVKVAPMQQMENIWPGTVIGTHPLFGPQHGMDEDLPIALVQGRNCSDEALALATAFYEELSYRVFVTDADSHDKAMARIQNMNFITSLAYCAQTADDESLQQFITPSFKRRLTAAKKLLTEDGAMFAGLFDANPYSMQAVRQFSKLLSLASAGDIDLLLNKARRWWKDDGAASRHD